MKSAAESEAICDSINRKLELMRDRMRADMSEEELRLEAELEEARVRRRALPPPDGGWADDEFYGDDREAEDREE